MCIWNFELDLKTHTQTRARAHSIRHSPTQHKNCYSSLRLVNRRVVRHLYALMRFKWDLEWRFQCFKVLSLIWLACIESSNKFNLILFSKTSTNGGFWLFLDESIILKVFICRWECHWFSALFPSIGWSEYRKFQLIHSQYVLVLM